MKRLFGVTTAMTTPFTDDGGIDDQALADQTEYLISNGVDCLYPAGTTGEMLLCSVSERKSIAEVVVSSAGRRVPVYVHVGAQRQDHTIELARHACSVGADGIGVVTPPFFSMSDEALEEFYVEVCGSVPEDFPVYAYAIPQLAGNDLSPEVVAKIRRRSPNLIGIKYSYPDMNRILDYLTACDGELSVLPGADHLFLPALTLGCDGVVSGCSGPYPELFTSIYEAFVSGDYAGALRAQLNANRVIKVLRGGSDISIFKASLSRRGIRGGNVRKPLRALPEGEMTGVLMALDDVTSSF